MLLVDIIRQGECLVPSNFLLCSPLRTIKISYAGLLSRTLCGNLVLPQRMLCINEEPAAGLISCYLCKNIVLEYNHI
jgi:hypothetical protein